MKRIQHPQPSHFNSQGSQLRFKIGNLRMQAPDDAAAGAIVSGDGETSAKKRLHFQGWHRDGQHRAGWLRLHELRPPCHEPNGVGQRENGRDCRRDELSNTVTNECSGPNTSRNPKLGQRPARSEHGRLRQFRRIKSPPSVVLFCLGARTSRRSIPKHVSKAAQHLSKGSRNNGSRA